MTRRQRPEPGTQMMVDLDAVSLDLPVVGGEAAMMSALGQE